ncbi:aspartyl/asparaginyl beta-hydroxylase domain-containing protein [Streptomyces sp. NPDC059688]|uniref:Aspartyl/asparaginyl beta-hydroxylase domain-containing protein n=1 Tax=Streptomyces albidocamelliae TaxID=2981135 RepID=A0ABY6EZ32_9ACTN|nr:MULTISPECIES: aspartyl/asparaginyl beta-hydroxylase domain-containing protein [unclassified Streptomyces]ROP47711.1 aspartyl/asparaginyl beta-hydroxylase [Streptomyces sp. PanSC9]UXY39674.1 aspartyl/asparaginyl beta-hydroxylase domain-containing protein [Streptomyces sp. HUAS 14-6]
MTPETDDAFAAIRSDHGATSLSRVERMLEPGGGGPRHPLRRGARWILPGLSATPWHEPRAHPELVPVVEALERAHPAIKDESTSAWEMRREAFSAYEHYLTRQEDWQALHLYRGGAMVEPSAALVPTAYKVLEEFAVDSEKICPLLESHFSTLLPGASIAPHCDLWNFSINLHLAVDIPDGCSITVAGETRTWQEGRCLLFDYSFEHEARNDGDRPRTCLLVDLWHPETTLAERRALVVLVTEVRRLMGADG